MDGSKYFPLVGKYVRMEKSSTGNQDDPAGMECLVAAVIVTSDVVEIVADYGYSFVIWPQEEDQWKFMVWMDEATRDLMKNVTWPS